MCSGDPWDEFVSLSMGQSVLRVKGMVWFIGQWEDLPYLSEGLSMIYTCQRDILIPRWILPKGKFLLLFKGILFFFCRWDCMFYLLKGNTSSVSPNNEIRVHVKRLPVSEIYSVLFVKE